MACESTWGSGLFAKNKKFLATLTVTGTGGGLGPVPPSPPAPSPQPRAGGQGAGGRRLSAVGCRLAIAAACAVPGALGHLGHGRAGARRASSRLSAVGCRLWVIWVMAERVTQMTQAARLGACGWGLWVIWVILSPEKNRCGSSACGERCARAVCICSIFFIVEA